MRKKRGFTLVELLMVIAIIGILSAILLPVLHRARDEARETEAINELHALDSGIKMFEMDNGQYPPNGNANLMVSLRSGSYINNIEAGDLREGKMLDPWKNPYVYLNPGIINPRGYDLYSLREDDTLLLAGKSGLSIGPVASVFKEVGAKLSSSLFLALSSPSQGFTPPSLHLSSPDLNIGGNYSLSGITLDAWNLLENSSASSIASLIGARGFQTSITVGAGTTSGVYYLSANTMTIAYTDSGNDDYNAAKVAAVMAHEGLHAIYDNMGTAYNPSFVTDGSYYSIDEEYQNDVTCISIWKELKNGATDTTLDYYEYLIDNGEDYTKAALRNSSTYGNLVEYPGWQRW